MTTTTNILQLTVPPDAWEEVGDEDDPRNRLIATLYLNTLPMHLEAYEVYVDPDNGLQVTKCSDLADLVVDLHYGFGADGHWQTLDIEGREYLVFASPHC